MSTKTTKIIYWSTTELLTLFLLMGIIFLNKQESIDGMKQLGVPMWLYWEISYGKILGALLLILPFVSKRIKEWVYVALGIDFISAVVALNASTGISAKNFSPLIFLVVLAVSYYCFHKLNCTDCKKEK